MTGRFHGIDALRGLALVNMVLYHLLYDINTVYGLQAQWINTPFVRFWQQCICWSFILIAGFSWEWGREHNLRRGLKLTLYGILISLLSVILLPNHAIWFGILNFLGAAILLHIVLAPPHQSPVAPCRRHIGTGTALSPERHSTWHHRPRLGFTKRPLYHLPRCAPWASAGIFYLHRLLPNSLVVPGIFMRHLPLPPLFAMPRLPTPRPHPYPRSLRSRTPLHRCLPHPSAHPAIHLLPLHGPAGLTVEGV